VRNAITAGQPLTQGRARFKPGDRGFLAAALGPGMRAVTVAGVGAGRRRRASSSRATGSTWS
jgi:Flp pilus assembly protein CpaB